MSGIKRWGAPLVALVALGSCGGSVALAQASTTATSGTGTLTLSGPDRTVTTPQVTVSCVVAEGQYRLDAVVERRGRELAVDVDVPGYAGPGSYTAAVHVLARDLYGRYSRTFEVPLVITGSGGTATISRTLPGTVYPVLAGKTVSLKAVWTCAV